MTSISCKNNRYGSDRIVVGYIDGKIHLHNLNRDRLYEIYVVDCIGCTPVSFHVCGEDRIIANYITKQYIIGLSR